MTLSAPPESRLTRREAVCLTALLVGAFSVPYGEVIRTLVSQWWTNDTYSFGFLVPLISAYLIWVRRDRLRLTPIRPAVVTGGIVMAAAAALLILGRVSAIVAFRELSLVLMIAGVVTLVLGRRMLRELWFPLAYLLLALPVWEVLTDPLHRPSQLLSAEIATSLLHAIGIPAHQQGVLVQLPNITLEVASICSGVNFLIAVIAIGVPQAYLFLRGWAARTAVLVFAVIVALLSNGVRVALIGVLSYHKLSASLHGPGHILQGLFVSTIGFVAIFVGIGLLAKWFPRSATAPARQGNAETAAPSRAHVGAPAIAAVALLLVLGMFRLEGLAVGATASSSPELPPRWHPVGTQPARFVAGGPMEENVARVFEGPDGARITLFVGDLAYAAPNSGELQYRSLVLPVSAGTSQVNVAEPGAAPLRVTRAGFRDDGRDVRVMSWYDLDGRPTTHGTVAKAHITARLLSGRPAQTRLVIVAGPGVPIDHAEPDTLGLFVRDVSAALAAGDRGADRRN